MDLVSAMEKRIALLEFGYPWLMNHGYDMVSFFPLLHIFSRLHSGAMIGVWMNGWMGLEFIWKGYIGIGKWIESTKLLCIVKTRMTCCSVWFIRLDM